MTKKPRTKVTPPKRFSRTKSAIRARARLRQLLYISKDDRELWRHVQRTTPEAWATLEEDLPFEEEKVKLSLRLDKSVVATFRATGPGYQARINHVLATYVQMQIADVRRLEADMEALLTEQGSPLSEDLIQQLDELGITEFIVSGDDRGAAMRILGKN